MIHRSFFVRFGVSYIVPTSFHILEMHRLDASHITLHQQIYFIIK